MYTRGSGHNYTVIIESSSHFIQNIYLFAFIIHMYIYVWRNGRFW